MLAWSKIPSRYVKKSVAKVENNLAELADAGCQFPKKKCDNPFVGCYTPYMDDKPALEKELVSW